jgi:hypothetical protein
LNKRKHQKALDVKANELAKKTKLNQYIETTIRKVDIEKRLKQQKYQIDELPMESIEEEKQEFDNQIVAGLNLTDLRLESIRDSPLIPVVSKNNRKRNILS